MYLVISKFLCLFFITALLGASPAEACLGVQNKIKKDRLSVKLRPQKHFASKSSFSSGKRQLATTLPRKTKKIAKKLGDKKKQARHKKRSNAKSIAAAI